MSVTRTNYNGFQWSAAVQPKPKDIENTVNQSKLEVITCSSRKARETNASESRLVLVLILIGWRELRRNARKLALRTTRSHVLSRKLHSGTSITKAAQGGLVRVALF